MTAEKKLDLDKRLIGSMTESASGTAKEPEIKSFCTSITSKADFEALLDFETF